MAVALNFSNKSYVNGLISFDVTWQYDQYSESKILVFSVDGNVIGEGVTGQYSGSGHVNLTYLSNSNVNLTYQLWIIRANGTRFLSTLGGTEPFTNTSNNTSLPITNMALQITNALWNGNTVTYDFSWSYSDGLAKFLIPNVNGIGKGELKSTATASGSSSFAFSSTSSSITVNFELYQGTSSGARSPVTLDTVTLTLQNGISSTPPPSIPSPNWTSTTFGNDVKLVDGILSGTITVSRGGGFDTSFNNEPLKLIVQIKSNGIVQDLFDYPFFMGVAATITKTLNRILAYPSITVELYVMDAIGRIYSDVNAKLLTNQSSTPTVTLPVPPVLQLLPSSLSGYKLLKWNKISNADTFNIETFTPSFPNWNSMTGDFVAGASNDLGSNEWGINIVIGIVAGDYRFRIRSKNSAGYSNYSQEIAYTIDNTQPPPVTTIPNPPVLQMLVSGQGSNYRLLKWNKDENVDQYNIESSNPLTDPLWQSLTGDFTAGTSNDLLDNHWGINLVIGTQDGLYKYRIRAKNSVGYSNYSNVVSYTINNNVPTPTPDSKNLLSKATQIFSGLAGLSLLVSKK